MASTYTVTRSRTVQAPPERVYLLLSDFKQWPRWSPWEGLDPDMERAYSGPDSGLGATYGWSGNRKAGTGRMEITGAVEPRQLDIALDFDKPFKSSNTTSFTLEPKAGDTTEVTWRMVGPKPLLMRVFGFVFNMEKMIGKDFEKGLEQLDAVARPKPAG